MKIDNRLVHKINKISNSMYWSYRDSIGDGINGRELINVWRGWTKVESLSKILLERNYDT